MEGVGAAASVVGLVSFGIQVAGGISSYIDAVKTRKEELAAISKSVRHMHSSIDVLKNGIPTSYQAASSAVSTAIKAREEELEALSALLRSLLDFPSQQLHGLESSVRQQKKRLSYPFHRPSLEKLQRRLDSADDVLHTAIQALELTVVSSIDSSVSAVKSKLEKNSENILVVASKSKAMNTSISAMQESLLTGNEMVASIKEDLHTVLPQKADLTAAVQRMGQSVVMSLVTTELQYNTINATLSVLSADTVRQSDLERTITRRIETKLDQLLEAQQLSIGGQISTQSRYGQLTAGQIALGRLIAKPSNLRRTCDQFPDLFEGQQITASEGAMRINEMSDSLATRSR